MGYMASILGIVIRVLGIYSVFGYADPEGYGLCDPYAVVALWSLPPGPGALSSLWSYYVMTLGSMYVLILVVLGPFGI